MESMSTAFFTIDLLIVAFSVAAAYYWLMSAKVRVPSYPDGQTSPTMKNAHAFRLIEQISVALKVQSQISAKAARFAAIAAALTGLSVILHNLPLK